MLQREFRQFQRGLRLRDLSFGVGDLLAGSPGQQQVKSAVAGHVGSGRAVLAAVPDAQALRPGEFEVRLAIVDEDVDRTGTIGGDDVHIPVAVEVGGGGALPGRAGYHFYLSILF